MRPYDYTLQCTYLDTVMLTFYKTLDLFVIKLISHITKENSCLKTRDGHITLFSLKETSTTNATPKSFLTVLMCKRSTAYYSILIALRQRYGNWGFDDNEKFFFGKKSPKSFKRK